MGFADSTPTTTTPRVSRGRPATVKRELQALRAAFRLAAKPVRSSVAREEGWCRRWDLNAEGTSKASKPIHSITEKKGPTTDAPMDGMDHADPVQGHFRDSDPDGKDG
jgi:hypothetical protein